MLLHISGNWVFKWPGTCKCEETVEHPTFCWCYACIRYCIIIILLLNHILTHWPLGILQKTHFEASWVVFWLLFGYKKLKLTKNPSTGGALCGPLFQMPNISFQSLGISKERKIFSLGCKSDTVFSTLTFCFLFFCFSCLMIFLFVCLLGIY